MKSIRSGVVQTFVAVWLLNQGSAPAAETQGTAAIEPVIVASDAGCPGVLADNISIWVEADGARLRDLLGVKPLSPPLRETLRASLKARTARPLLVVYSGHARRGASGETELCLPGWTPRVSELLALISQSRPWVTFIISACASSHVDVSRQAVPTSILTTADDLLTAASLNSRPLRDDDVSARTSAFIEAFARTLEAGAAADVDGTGWISDSELLRHAREIIAKDGLAARVPDPPVLRLRRQSATTLPVKLLGSPRLRPATGNVTGPHATALISRLDSVYALASGSRKLPSPSADYFVLGQADPAVAQVMESEGFAAFPGDEATARDLASHISYAEVFLLTFQEGWFTVWRLRDKVRLVHRFGRDPSRPETYVPLLPRRQVIEAADEAGFSVRFRQLVPGRSERCVSVDGQLLSLPDRVPVLCQTETEGQCFRMTRCKS
jgi:hypothetical protein